MSIRMKAITAWVPAILCLADPSQAAEGWIPTGGMSGGKTCRCLRWWPRRGGGTMSAAIYVAELHTAWPGRQLGPRRSKKRANKRMQLTKLRAAPVLQAEVPPGAPAGRMDGGTASQLIRSVGHRGGGWA